MSEQLGTHTFVFADLAGYTALTEAHGDEHAPDAAPSSARPCACGCHNTEEVNAIGDALLLPGSDAAQAAGLAERIVCGNGARHRGLGVRAGIHAGTAVRRGSDRFGSAANVASRAADAARAGEVLCTEATRDTLGRQCRCASEGGRRSRTWPTRSPSMSSSSGSARNRRSLLTRSAAWRLIQCARLSAACMGGSSTSFCSERCALAFDEDPAVYLRRTETTPRE